MAFNQAQDLYKKNMQAAGTARPLASLSTMPREAKPTTPPLNAPSQAYKSQSVQTASKGDLTLLLYNGCLKFISRAETAIEAKDPEERHTFIMKAQDIIRELMITLRTDSDVGKNMMQLYDFILSRLKDANVNNDPQALQEAAGLVTDFRDTWKEVMKLDRQQRFGSGGQA
ncbi:flagellar export chaperone FliS [Sinobaca sp. H24]|uniref:flagellar export chaperone FliS n=1 Tax=Sinobaca sp. H24 TaxID=2923376 RepID=UPI0027E3A82A|nr:flagellar export chaperone FliS [Sinobaca sp. H24]